MAGSIYLPGIPNPFGLPTPKDWWLRPIADYDADLRIFPSQTHPVYVLARVAHHSGGLSYKFWSDIPGIHPNTSILLRNRIVFVCTIPREALNAPPQNIVQQLRNRDAWVWGGGNDEDAADKVANILDANDAIIEENREKAVMAAARERHEPARVSLLYRSGARVSLVKPPTWRGKQRPVTSPSGDAQPSAIPPAAGTPTL